MQWGLIGASRIADGFVIDAIRSVKGSDIVAVHSSDAERGRSFAARRRITRSTTDIHNVLDDASIDAVYISTTNEKHHAQALAAIAAGKHVLCEKPLAMSVADALEMVQAAADRGVVFATNHHLRNAGSHLAIRDIVAAGTLGTLRSVRVFHAVQLPEALQGWRIDDPAAGGGVIPDITVHDADTVRFHLGEDPESVVAMACSSGLGNGVEDSAMSVWQMPSGVMVQAHESFTHPYAGSGIEIHGSEGSVFGRDVMTQQPIGDVWTVTADGRQDIRFDTHNLYHRALGLFADAVAGHGQPAASGIDGVKSLAVALAVRDAATSGARVTVDYAGL